MRALVIDDSRATRAILSRILQSLGFSTADAADGQLALTWLADHGPVDLALVDWNMPVLDGLSFLKIVRANPAYASMKLLMVTTESDLDRMIAALEAGADEYAMKPFTAGVIREKLELLGMEMPGALTGGVA
ncbi:response regulator [Egicoccus halophilus]|uniref:response regulator n=1 Tax=Egicoccus halophilus TaxID=1670830 RepID=UPI0010306651|nr:response regulator [Egicoccus halophilus]